MKLRGVVAFVLALQLGACALIPALEGNLDAQLDRYLAEQEYGKALDVLAYVRKDHPDYARLAARRPQVEARAKAFEQAQIRRAADLTARAQWPEAFETYRSAINKMPQSTALRAELQSFRTKQAARVEELKLDRLVARARWLERAVALQETIVLVDPDDWRENRTLNDYKSEAAELAAELTRIGSTALENENLGVATRTLPIAARLSSSPSAESARDRLSQVEAEAAHDQRRVQDVAMKRLRQREATNTLAEYRKANGAGDLRRARQLMNRLVEVDGDNKEIQDERSKFEARLEKVLRTHLDAAISLYGRGRFEEAIAHWKSVLDIDPDHEQARAGIERAERVMQKLKQLREKQSPPKPASP